MLAFNQEASLFTVVNWSRVKTCLNLRTMFSLQSNTPTSMAICLTYNMEMSSLPPMTCIQSSE